VRAQVSWARVFRPIEGGGVTKHVWGNCPSPVPRKEISKSTVADALVNPGDATFSNSACIEATMAAIDREFDYRDVCLILLLGIARLRERSASGSNILNIVEEVINAVAKWLADSWS
jgi:hypothetical protein